MERKLNEANLELETILDNTMMGVLVLKGYRKIHRVNKQFLKMFGYESEAGVDWRIRQEAASL